MFKSENIRHLDPSKLFIILTLLLFFVPPAKADYLTMKICTYDIHVYEQGTIRRDGYFKNSFEVYRDEDGVYYGNANLPWGLSISLKALIQKQNLKIISKVSESGTKLISLKFDGKAQDNLTYTMKTGTLIKSGDAIYDRIVISCQLTKAGFLKNLFSL